MEAWRKAARENEALYRKVLAADFVPAHAEMHSHFDAEAAYCAVRALCRRRARRRVAYWISGVAAVCLLAVGLAGYWMALPEEQAPQMLAEAIIPPGEAKAELILADGASVFLGTGVQDSVFEQPGARVHTSGKHLNYVKGAQTAEMQYNILRIPRGGEYTVVLQDGTAVQLNSASELRYPVQFVGDERRVYLSGEAYFDVQRDTTRPFIVSSDGMDVRVYGTEFNVTAYEGEPLRTVLVNGKVGMQARSSEEIFLHSGEMGKYHAEAQKIEVQAVNTRLYTAWKDGTFAFNNETIEQIMGRLSRWYDLNVFYANEEVKSQVFDGIIPQVNNVGDILHLIEGTATVRFELKGNTVVVK